MKDTVIGTVSKVERHEALCQELNDLYARKNRDYGDSFHESFVEEGMTMARLRLSDKLNRFKQLSRDPDKAMVKDESIRDTLIDLANYALMTVLEMDDMKQGEEKVKTEKKTKPTVTYKPWDEVLHSRYDLLKEKLQVVFSSVEDASKFVSILSDEIDKNGFVSKAHVCDMLGFHTVYADKYIGWHDLGCVPIKITRVGDVLLTFPQTEDIPLKPLKRKGKR